MTDKATLEIPAEFLKIMRDFVGDMLTTFPEYSATLDANLRAIVEGRADDSVTQAVYDHVRGVYPERFFDLLYQNNDIFCDASKNTMFLPGIDFADVWKQDITDKTRTVIWKYLQLVLFSVTNSEKDSNSFGDTVKLFEAIDEEELKGKLEEAMEQMVHIFDASGVKDMLGEQEQTINLDELPDPDQLHNHISGLLDGNLGKLASEITEETMKEFQDDMEGVESVGDVFQKLFKNPGKLMGMIKKVGSALDTKLQSGEIKESELMQEAAELMDKMQSMPGMKNMQSMLGQLGIPGGRNSKVDVGGMQNRLQRNARQAKMKERMRAKLAARQDSQIAALREQLASVKAANAACEATLQAPGGPPPDSTEEVGSKKRARRRRRKKAKNKK